MSQLHEKIVADMKEAMKAKHNETLITIRMLLAAIKQKEIDERIKLDDAQVITIIEKLIKQRRESVDLYQRGSRQDLAAKEQAEIALLQKYLPEQLDDQAIDQSIKATITALNAQSVADMGKVMAEVKTKLAGRADMKVVSLKVKQALS